MDKGTKNQILAKLKDLEAVWGENAKTAVNQVIGFHHVYGNKQSYDIVVTDRFLIVTPKDASDPIYESELAIDMSTGSILVDSNGLFLEHKRSVADAITQLTTGLVRGDYDQDLARARKLAQNWN